MNINGPTSELALKSRQQEAGHTAARCIAGVAFFVATCLTGCDSSDNGRVRAKGSVSVEGHPVAYGSVSLRPVGAEGGVASGAEIRKGAFEIPKKIGPSIGEYSARFTIVNVKGNAQGRLDAQVFEVPVEIKTSNEEYVFDLLPEARVR